MPSIPCRRSAASLAVLFAAVLAASPGSPASARQDPADPPTAAFVDTVQVNVVNVDVYVTDRRGEPVTGLTADDFEIFEDGRPMAVSNFYAVEDGRRAGDAAVTTDAAEGAEAPGAAAPPLPTDAAGPELPEEQRLHLVVYVDNVNIEPFHRNRVVRELSRFVSQELRPGDRAMVVSFDRELRVRRPFTSDPDAIASALRELERVSGQGVHEASRRTDYRRRVEESDSAAEAVQWARQYAQETRHELDYAIDALRDLVVGLAALPGRKALIYVSDGLPMIPGQDLYELVQLKFDTSGAATQALAFDRSTRFRELAAQANSQRVTFYTIDARGLTGYSAGTVEDRSPQSPGVSAMVDRVINDNLQSTLQMLAEETGGRAILNTNRAAPDLEKVARDFRTYYSLGYLPAHSGDGRYYRIEVRVKRPGVEVRHRTGYRDRPLATRMADSVLSALRFPVDRNGLGALLEIGSSRPHQDGLWTQTLLLKVPYSQVVLLADGERRLSRLRLWLAVADREGGQTDVSEVEVPVIWAGDTEPAPGELFVFPIEMVMRAGPQRVALVLRDELGGGEALLTRSVIVGR